MHNKGILIKASKLNLQGQGDSKKIRIGFKWSLVEAIGASSNMQPLACLRKDEVIPCKMFITSTHALPHIPKVFFIYFLFFIFMRLLDLLVLSGYLRCIMNEVGTSNNPMKLN